MKLSYYARRGDHGRTGRHRHHRADTGVQITRAAQRHHRSRGHQGRRHQRQRHPDRAEAGHRRRRRIHDSASKGSRRVCTACTCTRSASASRTSRRPGGHFDPGPAGNPDPDANHPFHMGDIPNLEAGADGMAVLQGVTTRVTLSDGPLSLFDADGSAIIVHGESGSGHHRRAEIRRQRRPQSGVRGVHRRSSHRNQPFFTGRSSPVAPLSASVRCATTAANAVSCVNTSVVIARASHTRATTDPNAPRSASGSAAVGCSINSSAGPSAIARARCVRARTAGGSVPAWLFQPLRRDVAFLRQAYDALERLRLNRIDRQREGHRQVLRQGRALEDHRPIGDDAEPRRARRAMLRRSRRRRCCVPKTRTSPSSGRLAPVTRFTIISAAAASRPVIATRSPGAITSDWIRSGRRPP